MQKQILFYLDLSIITSYYTLNINLYHIMICCFKFSSMNDQRLEQRIDLCFD